MADPRVLILLAEGAEEMEVVITTDVLRRAGLDVQLAGLRDGKPVRCSRGVQLVPDLALAAATGDYDAIVVPGGGGGAERLAHDPEVGKRLRAQEERRGWIAAICAGPTALVAHGVGKGRRFTCHPSAERVVAGHGRVSHDPVVVDGNLITSRGPGTAFEFALAIAAALVGRERADSLREPMLVEAR